MLCLCLFFIPLSLSRCLYWCYGSLFTWTGHKAQRLLAVTLARRHLERSWDITITSGDILNNDSGHLLYGSTRKTPAGSAQGQPDMTLGQGSEITTFAPGLNCAPPVALLHLKFDVMAKLRCSSQRKWGIIKRKFLLRAASPPSSVIKWGEAGADRATLQ